MQGRITDLNVSIFNSKQKLTLELDGDFRIQYDELKDKEIEVTIKPYRKKRSLNANALCWKLCTEIANILRTDKDSVYLTMLRRYGQSDIVSVLKGVDVKPYFKYFEEAGEGKINGKVFTHYKVFQGSSEYDTRYMSIFLDGIVSEAKEMGIPVLTERELSLMKEEWGR